MLVGLLITYKKSYMGFRLVPKSVDLKDLEWSWIAMAVILRYSTEFWSFGGRLRKN